MRKLLEALEKELCRAAAAVVLMIVRSRLRRSELVLIRERLERSIKLIDEALVGRSEEVR